MTLTLAEDGRPLIHRLNRLQHSFTRFTRTVAWRYHVKAYAAFLEFHPRQTDIKTAAEGREFSRGWNVHFHVVAIGRFWPQREIAERWRAITGDSFIVDIRLCRDAAKVGKYVTKYASKPVQTQKYETESDLQTAILALRNRKIIKCGGEWRHAKLTAAPDAEGWERYCHVNDVFESLARREPIEQGIMQLLSQGDFASAIQRTRERAPPVLRTPTSAPDPQAKFDFGVPF